jgi:DNA-binding beta-propeller fold protein YncE
MHQALEPMRTSSHCLFCLLLLSMFATCHAQEKETLPQLNKLEESKYVSDSLLPTGRLLSPAGVSVEIYGRPNDMALSIDGRWLLVKDWKSLRVLDANSMQLVQTITSPGNASLNGLAVLPTGDVLFTNAQQEINVFRDTAKPEAGLPNFQLVRSMKLPNKSFPCGIESSKDGKTAYVCLAKRNSVAVVDLESGEIQHEISVGVAPFDVAIKDDQLFVSNIGGRIAVEGDMTAPSADTETVVDKRGIASTGTISVINLDTNEVKTTIDVGRHPSTILAAEDCLLVCNTNEDSVSCISADGKNVELNVKPDDQLPFGSMPSGICSANKDSHVFVTLAGNNAVAVIDPAKADRPVVGLIPTGWYPVCAVSNEKFLFVANVKGVGARTMRRKKEEGGNSHDHRGTIQQIPLDQIRDEKQLAQWTATVKKNGHFPQILRSMVKGDAGMAQPIPVPEKLGQPSLFKHVIYVIKENRTFDQVFGDIEEARGDKSLCLFPEKVTPNHHALARRFGVLDNYYCNGVLSADGHSWATEGNVTPYLERAFGGFARSYTFGDDPITYSSSGFIWDRFLDAGLSFRNYGEFNYSEPPEGMKYQEIFAAYEAGEETVFEQKIGVQRVLEYSCREYPGWNMVIPDVVRMDRFLKEFREFEEKGTLPNLCLVYLPQDHLGGGVTSNGHMADNDLALGRLVEAVSKSKFWDETVIFVNEDDPQNGFDHIDGHRSLCLVISPYSQPGVNHSFYNQTSVLRTMLHLFGLVPLNQQDASMPLMRDCFAKTKINAEPFTALPANFPLNESPQPKEKQSSLEQRWRQILATVPIQRTGMKTEKDEDHLNRFIWHDVKGWETPYPASFAGSHGKGLEALGLVVGESEE